MKNVEYLIVGGGFAGIFFAHQLIKNGKSFVLFSEPKPGASRVSAGMVNPVVLKKFTTFWKAQEQIDFLNSALEEIKSYTNQNYLIRESVHRILHNEDERNLWLKKSEDESLKRFLSPDFISFDEILNPFQTGEVLQSSRLDIDAFFDDMFNYLRANEMLEETTFRYDTLDTERNIYNNEFHFQSVVFCEGMGVVNNPFFNEIPVIPNKGHHLKVKLSRNLDTKVTLKKKHFLFPIQDDLYFYGGTYDRDSKDESIDEAAVNQLKLGLSEFYPYDFEIKEVKFGFRPTVKDRRPIAGRHSVHQNFYIFNGLGARGVLNGCYFSKMLFDFIESNIPLPPEIDLNRF